MVLPLLDQFMTVWFDRLQLVFDVHELRLPEFLDCELRLLT